MPPPLKCFCSLLANIIKSYWSNFVVPVGVNLPFKNPWAVLVNPRHFHHYFDSPGKIYLLQKANPTKKMCAHKKTYKIIKNRLDDVSIKAKITVIRHNVPMTISETIILR